MYYNRNLITAAKHEVTVLDGSGVFDLQAQAVFKSQNIWPGLSTDDIIYTIDTSLTTGTTFTLRSRDTVDYIVDWGDGNSETSTSNDLAHAYASSGTYVIKVKSNSGIYRPFFNNSGDGAQITSIVINDTALFGAELWSAFYGAGNLTSYTQVASVTSNVQNFSGTWYFCSSLTTFPLIDTSSATNLFWAWRRCSSLTSFPLINTSNVTNFNEAWGKCGGLTSFPLIDTSSGEYVNGWQQCSSLTSFPALDFSSMISAGYGWASCTSLTTFPANMFDTTGTLITFAFNNAWSNCALTAQSIENILTSLDTNGATGIDLGIGGGINANASTWSYDALIAFINLENKGWTITKNGDATDISYKITIASNGDSFTLKSTGTVNYTVDWGDGNSESSTSNTLAHTYASAGTYVVKVNSNSGAYNPSFVNSSNDSQITSIAIGTDDPSVFTYWFVAFYGANNLTSYKQISSATSNVTHFREAWRACTNLSTFPLIDVSSGTDFLWTWRGCSSLTSFPLLEFSSATELHQSWQNCSGLTSFPLIDTSNCTLVNSWPGCSSLTSFPALDFSSMTNAGFAWYACSLLATFPANMFDTTGTLITSAFDNAWTNCALTAQSIENILTSLDTNGASNITLGINGGTNASKSTWSTAANTAYNNLITKGWTISYNS